MPEGKSKGRARLPDSGGHPYGTAGLPEARSFERRDAVPDLDHRGSSAPADRETGREG